MQPGSSSVIAAALSVSIHTSPRGKVQHGCTQLNMSCFAVSIHTSPRGKVQHYRHAHARTQVIHVSIHTSPRGKVQLGAQGTQKSSLSGFNPHLTSWQGATLYDWAIVDDAVQFQSTPHLVARCNLRKSSLHKMPTCFNPHLTSWQGATMRKRGKNVWQPSFNPHLTSWQGATPACVRWRVSRLCFNPHLTSWQGAT